MTSAILSAVAFQHAVRQDVTRGLKAEHEAVDLLLRAGEPQTDVDVEGQFLLQQIVGDGVDAEFLRQFGHAAGQGQDDVVGFVFLLQQGDLPQHRLG